MTVSRLVVQMSGVPDGKAQIVVSSGQWSLAIHKSRAIRVPPGKYRVRARPVVVGKRTYTPYVKDDTIKVPPDGKATAHVRYKPVPIPADPVPPGYLAVMHDLINATRVSAGLKPLKYNAELGRAAQLFAEDMAAGDYFSHISDEGTDFIDRIKETDWPGLPAGENIASGFPDAQATFNGWMNSPHHKSNILNSEFTHHGLGHTLDPQPGYILPISYWVNDFGYDH